ncbi:MAG: M20/M25/M40 family metallo-hydrolase [Ignisphaera sp.]|uniref:Putative [LysW]-lysine/[LysW]-ornithine hydrolase n=1 Tax=Ignisphaera aggregans TaxID=334771 RepID=A0A7C4JLM6_9CREN
MSNASLKNLALEMLLNLLKAYSPPRKEEKAIGILREYAKKLGYENILVDEAGNLVASYGHGDVKLAVIGHIDTVPWELPVEFDGYAIFGRGAVDAKGPLVAAFIGFALAKQYIDPRRLSVYAIAVIDEEGDSLGAKYLVKSGFKADGVIVAEPSNTDGVVLGYRGSARFLVTCQGTGGHSSSGTENSACDKLISVWNKIKNLYNSAGNVYEHTPALLKLWCGEDAPISPRYGEALISIRIALNSGIESITKNVDAIVNSFNDCRWNLLDYTKSVKVSANNIAARATIRAILMNDLRPRILYKYGTSDMNILYPTVTENIVAYGPGKSELAHTAKEYITIDELIKGMHVYRDLAKEFINLSIRHTKNQ